VVRRRSDQAVAAPPQEMQIAVLNGRQACGVASLFLSDLDSFRRSIGLEQFLRSKAPPNPASEVYNEGPDLGAEFHTERVSASWTSGRVASLDGCSVLDYIFVSEHSGVLLGASFRRPEGLNNLIQEREN